MLDSFLLVEFSDFLWLNGAVMAAGEQILESSLHFRGWPKGGNLLWGWLVGEKVENIVIDLR